MNLLVCGLLLLTAALWAESSTPVVKRLEWDPAAPGASKQLGDGRTQKTMAMSSVRVSAIAAVTEARRFVDPHFSGGSYVSYIAVGVQNLSETPIHIDPTGITLRVLGKKERYLKRLTT